MDSKGFLLYSRENSASNTLNFVSTSIMAHLYCIIRLIKGLASSRSSPGLSSNIITAPALFSPSSIFPNSMPAPICVPWHALRQRMPGPADIRCFNKKGKIPFPTRRLQCISLPLSSSDRRAPPQAPPARSAYRPYSPHPDAPNR